MELVKKTTQYYEARTTRAVLGSDSGHASRGVGFACRRVTGNSREISLSFADSACVAAQRLAPSDQITFINRHIPRL